MHFLNSEQSGVPNKRSFLLLSGQRIDYFEDSKDRSYEHSRGQALQMMSEDERRFFRTRTYLFDLGHQAFSSLLDELNAYTIGLRTAVRFPKILGANEREGPLEMTLFTLRYLEAMKKQDVDYFKNRIENNKDLLKLIRALIRDAYEAVNSACDRTDLNQDDGPILAALKTPRSLTILQWLFNNEAPTFLSRCYETQKFNTPSADVTSIEHPKTSKDQAAYDEP